MNLSPPTITDVSSPSTNDNLRVVQPSRDRSAVIQNDWVPAIHLSTMHHAQPVRIAGPLRPKWYVETAMKILVKVVRLRRQTA